MVAQIRVNYKITDKINGGCYTKNFLKKPLRDRSLWRREWRIFWSEIFISSKIARDGGSSEERILLIFFLKIYCDSLKN
jgi:hypothetical protein